MESRDSSRDPFLRVSVSKAARLETLNVAKKWFSKVPIIKRFLFVVFSGKKQQKHVGKMPEIRKKFTSEAITTFLKMRRNAQILKSRADMSIGLDLDWTGSGPLRILFDLDWIRTVIFFTNLGSRPDLDWDNGKICVIFVVEKLYLSIFRIVFGLVLWSGLPAHWSISLKGAPSSFRATGDIILSVPHVADTALIQLQIFTKF